MILWQRNMYSFTRSNELLKIVQHICHCWPFDQDHSLIFNILQDSSKTEGSEYYDKFCYLLKCTRSYCTNFRICTLFYHVCFLFLIFVLTVNQNQQHIFKNLSMIKTSIRASTSTRYLIIDMR